GADHGGAVQFRHLHRAGADTAGGAVHEHGLARPHPGQVEQGVFGGDHRDRGAAQFGPDAVGGGADELGAGDVVALDHAGGGQADAVADAQPGDAGTDPHDRARALHAGGGAEMGAREVVLVEDAEHFERVLETEADGGHADLDFARSGLAAFGAAPAELRQHPRAGDVEAEVGFGVLERGSGVEGGGAFGQGAFDDAGPAQTVAQEHLVGAIGTERAGNAQFGGQFGVGGARVDVDQPPAQRGLFVEQHAARARQGGVHGVG